jgi:hypothetical protein
MWTIATTVVQYRPDSQLTVKVDTHAKYLMSDLAVETSHRRAVSSHGTAILVVTEAWQHDSEDLHRDLQADIKACHEDGGPPLGMAPDRTLVWNRATRHDADL